MMIYSVYILVLVGVLIHLWIKNIDARKKPDYHWKIFWYKMWEASILNIVSGWVLVYIVVDSQWGDMSLWIARLSGLAFGWGGTTLLNKYIKNGPKSTNDAKEMFNV